MAGFCVNSPSLSPRGWPWLMLPMLEGPRRGRSGGLRCTQRLGMPSLRAIQAYQTMLFYSRGKQDDGDGVGSMLISSLIILAMPGYPPLVFLLPSFPPPAFLPSLSADISAAWPYRPFSNVPMPSSLSYPSPLECKPSASRPCIHTHVRLVKSSIQKRTASSSSSHISVPQSANLWQLGLSFALTSISPNPPSRNQEHLPLPCKQTSNIPSNALIVVLSS